MSTAETQSKPDFAAPEGNPVWFLILDPFSEPGYLLLEGPPPDDLAQYIMESSECGDLTMLRLHADPGNVESRESSGWLKFKRGSWEIYRARAEELRKQWEQ